MPDVSAEGSVSAEQAYAYGAGAYQSYADERAKGKSEAEALGAMGGAIGGAAACSATGAGVAVAGLCGTLGGVIGGIVGKAFGDLFGSKPDQADAVCSEVAKRLDAMLAAASQNGIQVSREQAQRWFADGATRAQLPAGSVVHGEIGVAGAKVVIGPDSYILPPGSRFTLTASGIPAGPDGQPLPARLPGPKDRFGNITYPLTVAGVYPMVAVWSPVGRCVFDNMRLTEVEGVSRSMAIGLAAVAARIDGLNRAQEQASAFGATATVAAAGLFGWLGWRWWKRRNRRG